MDIELDDMDLEEINLNNSSVVKSDSRVFFPKKDLLIKENGFAVKSEAWNEIDATRITEKEKIGEGVAAIVKKAYYYVDDDQVVTLAIKSIFIKEENGQEKEKRSQLLNDLQTYMSAESSDYLANFYGCYYKGQEVKLVFEFMDRGCLRKLIQDLIKNQLRLPEELLADMAYKMLQGLNRLHKKDHKIHRDLKPQNILLNSKGEVKISDFGCSTKVQKTLGESNTYCGTCLYLSPERVQGSSYNFKSDIWSFGLILYELATLKTLPYKQGKNENSYLISKKINDLPSPSLDENFTPEMRDFLQKCLQKDQKKRASSDDLLNHVWIQHNSNKGDLGEFLKKLNK